MPHARKAHPTIAVSYRVFFVTHVIHPRLQICMLLLQGVLATSVLCIQRLSRLHPLRSRREVRLLYAIKLTQGQPTTSAVLQRP